MAAWTATDRTGTGVASVDSSGLAKANAEGTSTIACAVNGLTASTLLTVTPATLTGITVNPTMTAILQGAYGSLTATGGYSDGSTQNLSGTAVWTTADLMGTNVASVAAGGKVFGKNAGQATITATVGAFSASAVVTVSAPKYIKLTIEASRAAVPVGSTLQFTARATLADGTTEDVTKSTTWTETDTWFSGRIASVDSNGLVTGRSTGFATIYGSFGGYTQSIFLIVF